MTTERNVLSHKKQHRFWYHTAGYLLLLFRCFLMFCRNIYRQCKIHLALGTKSIDYSVFDKNIQDGSAVKYFGIMAAEATDKYNKTTYIKLLKICW